MRAVNLRGRIRIEEKKAGKRRSLHSPKEGMCLFDSRKRHPGDVTHDDSNVLGWNNKK